MKYIIITENDESSWDDKTGEYYHYPSKYKSKISTGDKIIYYKGKMKDKNFLNKRLSKEPHYFGIGTIGEISEDKSIEGKTNFYAQIKNYQPFIEAVSFKNENKEYFEDHDRSNYFRDAVRTINEKIYNLILSNASLIYDTFEVNEEVQDYNSLTSFRVEGTKKVVYTTIYERDPQLRVEAIRIHGLICKGCDFDFEKGYGELGKCFIHVHHIKPISERGEDLVNPETDLTVLCPNCHSIVHRKKNNTLTIEELKSIIKFEILYI
jgi:putative restriction endonuclease